MTIQLTEHAADAIKAYLASNMAAKVTALNLRYTDTLPNIVTYYVGELPQRLPESPSICVRGSGFTPKLQRAGSIEIVSNIDVLVLVGLDDAERRWRMLCRYVVGIVELMRVAQTAGYIIRISGNVRLTEPMENPDFLQGFLVPLSVESTESY